MYKSIFPDPDHDWEDAWPIGLPGSLHGVEQCGRHIGTRKDMGEDDITGVDNESAPAEFLESVQTIQGALAEAHLEDVYESLEK